MSSSCYIDVVALNGAVQELEQLLQKASELLQKASEVIDKVDEATEQMGFDLWKSEGSAAVYQIRVEEQSRMSLHSHFNILTKGGKHCLQKKRKGPPDAHRDRSHYWLRRTHFCNYKE